MQQELSNQEDAALVAAMARQALADGEMLEMLADAGLTEAEARACFTQEVC